MSISISLVWDEVIWQSTWGKYLGHDMTDHAIVDGGLLSNFPIELFISDAPEVTKLMGAEKGESGLRPVDRREAARDEGTVRAHQRQARGT